MFPRIEDGIHIESKVQGKVFILVRIKRKDLLPDSKEEIISELKDYFIETIEKFNQKKESKVTP